jgi:glycosyltransferase involved in cell wall biosynthesis
MTQWRYQILFIKNIILRGMARHRFCHPVYNFFHFWIKQASIKEHTSNMQTGTSVPDIAIAVPVLNGADTLEACLRCLQAQETERAFEVVVYDNASKDSSADIAQLFADKDDRFRLVRRTDNIGALPNFEDGLRQSKSQYFMWRAHDDLSSTNYIEALAQTLDNAPRYNLAVGTTHMHRTARDVRIDAPPRITEACQSKLDIMRIALQLRAAWIYGLFRRDALLDAFDRIHTHYNHVWGFDNAVLLYFLLQGDIAGNAEALFEQHLVAKPDGFKKPSNLPELREDFQTLSKTLAQDTDFPRFARMLGYWMSWRVL